MIQTRATAAMKMAEKLKMAARDSNALGLATAFIIEAGKLFDRSGENSGEFVELFEKFIREASYSGRMVKGHRLRAQEYTKIVRPILQECENILARWRYHSRLKLYVEKVARQGLVALSADFLSAVTNLTQTQRDWFQELEDYTDELFKAKEIDDTLLRKFIELNYSIHEGVQPPTLHQSNHDEHLASIQKLEVEAMMLGLH